MFSTTLRSSRYFALGLSSFLLLIVATHGFAQAQQPQTGQRSQQLAQQLGQQSQPLAQQLRQQQQGAKPQYGPTRPQITAPQGRQPVRQANAGQNRQSTPRKAGPPNGFTLSAAEQAQVDKMLDFWEQKTSGIKTLECEFARWVYDPQFGPKEDAKTFTTGEIRYAAVDRGMIREAKVYDFDEKQKKAGVKWPYKEREDAIGEHWVCDGKSVFEFSHKTKELVEVKLPPNMQGNAIADGPLPFMFGAKADKIKQRYWIREIPRTAKEQPYQLELIPKRRGEDYSRIRVKLDPQKFLPTQMVLYELNLVGRSAYSFRKMKANSTANNLRNFMGGFVSPKTPRGWTKIVKNVGGTAPAPKGQQPPRAPQGQRLGQPLNTGRTPAQR